MKRIPPPGLREEVEAAVMAAVETIGIDGISKAEVVRPFMDRGVARSTLFAWVDALFRTGQPAARVKALVESAVISRAAAGGDPSEGAARDLVAVMPKPIQAMEIAAARGPDLLEVVRRCFSIAEKIIAHASMPDGSVKNAKLLLAGGEALRRAGETTLRVVTSLNELAKVDRFHDAIMEEIAKESPECAERIYRRMNAVIDGYGKLMD